MEFFDAVLLSFGKSFEVSNKQAVINKQSSLVIGPSPETNHSLGGYDVTSHLTPT